MKLFISKVLLIILFSSGGVRGEKINSLLKQSAMHACMHNKLGVWYDEYGLYYRIVDRTAQGRITVPVLGCAEKCYRLTKEELRFVLQSHLMADEVQNKTAIEQEWDDFIRYKDLKAKTGAVVERIKKNRRTLLTEIDACHESGETDLFDCIRISRASKKSMHLKNPVLDRLGKFAVSTGERLNQLKRTVTDPENLIVPVFVGGLGSIIYLEHQQGN